MGRDVVGSVDEVYGPEPPTEARSPVLLVSVDILVNEVGVLRPPDVPR